MRRIVRFLPGRCARSFVPPGGISRGVIGRPIPERCSSAGARPRRRSRVESLDSFLPQTWKAARKSARPPRDDPMQKRILALLALLLACLPSAHGAEVQVGRYQMIAVPASQSQTFPETLLLAAETSIKGRIFGLISTANVESG